MPFGPLRTVLWVKIKKKSRKNRHFSLGYTEKTYTPKGVLFGSVEISTKLCPGVNV